MKHYVLTIIALLICGTAYGQVNERLIGIWSETENSTRVIFTKDTIEINGEKIQIYTEFGRIISKRSNQLMGIYRFCTPEEFQKSAQGFIDAPVALWETTNRSVAKEEIAKRKEEITKELETEDSASGRAYRYFKNMEESAGKGNVIELDGSGQYLQRR
jgi:hypothetical protein